MTAKCLMLDVDGVLVDGRPSDGLPWSHHLKRDLAVDPDLIVEKFFKAEWNEIVVGKKELLPTLSTVLQRVAPSVSADDFIQYWFEMDARIIDPVLNDVRAARQEGIPVFLTTNQENMRAAYLTNTLGLGDDVDGIVYSAQAGSKKPQPEFFKFAEQVTDREPQELLLVDDTLANVESAKSVGWHAVHWDGTENLAAILARRIG